MSSLKVGFSGKINKGSLRIEFGDGAFVEIKQSLSHAERVEYGKLQTGVSSEDLSKMSDKTIDAFMSQDQDQIKNIDKRDFLVLMSTQKEENKEPLYTFFQEKFVLSYQLKGESVCSDTSKFFDDFSVEAIDFVILQITEFISKEITKNGKTNNDKKKELQKSPKR